MNALKSEVRCGAKGSILIVDDEALITRLMKYVLEQAGYDVHSAGSPDEAIEFCERSALPLGLVATDVSMPGMNGSEMALKILNSLS